MKLAGIIISFIVFAYAAQPLIDEVAQHRHLLDYGTEASCCEGDATETCACCFPGDSKKQVTGDPADAQETPEDHDHRGCDSEQPCCGICYYYQNSNVVNAIVCCISEVGIFGEEIEGRRTSSDTFISNHLSSIWHPPKA